MSRESSPWEQRCSSKRLRYNSKKKKKKKLGIEDGSHDKWSQSSTKGALIIYSLQAALEFIIMVTNALSLLIECFLERTSCYASQVWHAIQHYSNKVYKNLQWTSISNTLQLMGNMCNKDMGFYMCLLVFYELIIYIIIYINIF